MIQPLRSLAVLICGVLVVGAACRRGPNPLPLTPAAEARQVALGSAVLPNLDRGFDRTEAVAKVLGLPFDKAAKRKDLLDALKLPEATLSVVRTDAPVAIAVLPPPPNLKDPEVVAALTGRSPDVIKKAIARMGKPLATRNDASNFKVGERSLWLLPRGNLLLAATSVEALIAGGALALELAVPGEDDLTVQVFPAAIAKSQGTDVKTALAGAFAGASASLKELPGGNPMVSALLEGMLTSTVERLAEVDQAALSLRLDAEQGLAARLTATPRTGSKLARSFGRPEPFALDGRVLPEGETMAVMAFSPSELLGTLWTELRPMVAKDPPGQEAAKHIDVLLGGWASGGSGAVALVDGEMRMTGVYAMKKGIDGGAYLDAGESLLGGAWYKALLAQTETKTKVRVKRDKDALIVNTATGPAKGIPPAMAKALDQLGITSQTFAMVVEKETLYYASGKNAAAAARALPSAPPRQPAGLAGRAATESVGADLFFFLDLAPFVKMGAAAVGAGQNPMLAGLSLPLWFSYRSGAAPTLELRVPMELVKGVATFMPLFMGMGMGMGADMGDEPAGP
jgi:hypothetical protein